MKKKYRKWVFDEINKNLGKRYYPTLKFDSWIPNSQCYKRRHLGQCKGHRKSEQKHVEELKAQILLLPKLLEIKGMDGKGVAQSKGEGWYLQYKVVSIILLFNIYEVIQFSPIFEFKFFLQVIFRFKVGS